MCEIATKGIFQLADQINEVNTIYNSEETNKLLEMHETIRENHYVDAIFGDYSRLHNDDWLIASIKPENIWVFSAP